MRRLLVLLAALIVPAGCAVGSGESVAIPEQHIPLSRVPEKPLSAALMLPKGPGPFAAVIVLHGCGGLSSNSYTWARRLQDWGYAALVLDSFSARGVTTVCAPDRQPLVTPQDRAADVLSAALYLRSLPMIDGSRIAVLGNSHGGATAARVTERRFEQLYPGLLKASIDYYGPCGWPPEAHGHVPLLALAGEADNWGNPALSCRTYIGKLKPDQPAEICTYPGVWHAFDNPQQRFTTELGHNLGYDGSAAADSYERVRAFLAKWLPPKPRSG